MSLGSVLGREADTCVSGQGPRGSFRPTSRRWGMRTSDKTFMGAGASDAKDGLGT